MKKMLNKKFFLILGSTIALLVVLSVAMIFLTKENVKTFSKEGYIIASGNNDTSTKYYFDEGTSYKTNISSQLVFTDTSGEKVTVETDNFMHYIDGGIKFLKNGVIMDLNSIDSSTVPYYNITNKSVLEYTKKSYYIETIDKTLAFNNLAGRISDSKYIFAGVDIKLQLAGNDNIIEGDYFEVNFIENGIIKVENQEVSYQTTAEDSYILVDDNIRIDLGNKKIYYNDEEKMSLTQMTIDGNENIEIIPDEEDKNGNGDGEGDQTGEEPNTGEENNTTGEDGQTGTEDGEQTTDGEGDGQTGEPGDENGDGTEDSTGTGTGESTKRNASIDIVKAEVGVNNITASFILNDPDGSIKGDLVLHITNTDTGKRVYSTIVDKTQAEFTIGVSSLSPDSNYILSINEETNSEYDTQYFQKLFKTDTLGISLEKKYVTQDSLAYEVVFDENSEVNSAKITLYDEAYNAVTDSVVVTKNSSIAYFENLTNNTTYNVVLDDVIMDTMEYNKVYTISKTTKTLKKTPYLEGLSSTVDDETNTFTVGIDRVVDEDESITKYYYYIYKAEDITQENIDTLEPVKIIEKNDNGKVNIGIDNEKILPKTNYKFKAVAEYYDNEKYGEFETELSDNFILSGKPTVEFVINQEKTSFNKIVGTVVIKDDSCTVPMYGRGCSSIRNYSNNFTLEYKIINSTEKVILDKLYFNPKTLEYSLEIDNLIANTEYVFNLYGDVDLLDGKGIREGYLIGTFRASTSSVDILTVDTWKQNESTRADLVNVSAKISSSGENQNLGDSINNITFNLYAGDTINQLKAGVDIEPLASKQESGDLKDTYYNKLFTINTLDTFGITNQTIVDEETEKTTYISAIDVLKNMTDGKLQKYYTIEITDIFDNGFQNEIQIENNYFLFETPALLLMEDQLETPTITAEAIENSSLSDSEVAEQYGLSYNKQLNSTTIVGYTLNATASIDRISNYFEGGQPLKELIYYVCDEKKPTCDIENAVMTKVIDLTQTSDLSTVIPVGNGTKYSTTDTGELTRGHIYTFKLKFNIDTDNDGVADTYYPNDEVKTEIKQTPKQTPSYKAYILNTDENSANYKFEYYDIDNALYEPKIYYTIDDDLKNQVETPEPEEGEGDESEDETTEEEEGSDEVTTVEDETPEEETPEETPEDTVKSIDLESCTSITNTSTRAKGYLCDFKVENLSTDSVYKIAFKRALIKRPASVEDNNIGEFIFDGEFVYDDSTVTFSNITYENDNVLRIKINETNTNTDYINRISAYHIVLSADGVDNYERVYASDKVETCEDGEESYKCIKVDYADIKEFKTKNISVKVTAYYDSGIIDNTFAASNSNISEALANQTGYILQTNNKYNKTFTRAKYIYIRDNGSITTSQYPSGIYTYKKALSTSVDLLRMLDLTNNVFAETPDEITMTLFTSNDGIYTKDSSKANQSVNNKLLSTVDLGTTKNTFKFNSIIPKINVSTAGLVNGARVTIKTSGVDEDILKNEFKAEDDGKYYYYLDIYKDSEKTELYQTAKVEISLESTGSVIELTKYMPNTTYYFEVSAYLLKEKEYKKTLLFDASQTTKYATKLYKFDSLAPEKIYPTRGTPKASYTSTSDTTNNKYLKRELTLEMLPNTNIGEYLTRFELYDINGNIVLEETVELAKQGDGSTKAKVVKDITPTESEMNANGKGGYIFGEGYYTMKVYIITDVYTSEEAPEGKAEMLIFDSEITLTKLKDPTYVVKRTKKTGESDYGTNDLQFEVTVSDTNRVIKDGEYCAVLLDYLEQPIDGIDPECGLSATEAGKKISYSNLKSDTIYIFKVYADVYTNNVNVADSDKNREVYENTLVTTNTDYDVALGQVIAYGSSSKVTLSFDSGINVQNVKKIQYTLLEQSSTGNGGARAIASQIYIMGSSSSTTEELGDGTEIAKTFTTDGSNVELVINPTGLTLTKGYTYNLGVKFYIQESGQYVLLKEASYGVKY